MRNTDRLTIRWNKNRLRKFTELCGKANVSKIARDILEAWMACKLDPEERRALGFIPEWEKMEPAVLTAAINEYRKADR